VSKNLFIMVFAVMFASGCLAGQGFDYSPPWAFNPSMPIGQPTQGEIRNLHGRAADLMVVLSPISGGRTIQQAQVENTGFFQLGAVPPGMYVIRLVHLPDETILEQTVQIGVNGQSITLQLPEAPAQAAAATISADQLQHPLTSRGAKMIRKAQEYAEAGDHSKAIEELKRALTEPSAIPYAHSILGTEYLKTGQAGLAQGELEQAVEMLPHEAVLHSNLAYALFLRGDADRGEQEVRKALDLDHNNSHAQRLLGYILKARHAAQ